MVSFLSTGCPGEASLAHDTARPLTGRVLTAGGGNHMHRAYVSDCKVMRSSRPSGTEGAV
jgi:hypothetical protein